MTVIPFPTENAGGPGTSRRSQFSGSVTVTGAFRSPTGRTGSFAGTYRLDRFVEQYGQLATAGVFAGELTDADGTRVGVGSRRHTAAVELEADAVALVARVGPLDVNVLGFVVSVDEFEMRVRRSRLTESTGDVREMPPTASELMTRAFVASAEAPAPMPIHGDG